jgi:predicted metal-dependent HD superfamily phosphohydrolase
MELATQWRELAQSVGWQHEGREWNELSTRYAEPHRAYHNIQHIAHCLRELAAVRPHFGELPEVALAVWFHDIVYNPKAQDNEEQSVGLFRQLARPGGLPPRLVEEVSELIMATRHNTAPPSLATQVMLDVDLSIFGQAPVAFDAYEEQIRREYEWMSFPKYVRGRSLILQKFLHRSHIYETEHFRQRYEDQARANLKRSLEQLQHSLMDQVTGNETAFKRHG